MYLCTGSLYIIGPKLSISPMCDSFPLSVFSLLLHEMYPPAYAQLLFHQHECLILDCDLTEICGKITVND